MSAGVVIIGGGQAGLEVAAALRAQNFEGAITIVGEEPHAPYQRPPLSKEYLLGKMNADSLPLRAPQFYEKHRIAVRTRERVVAIERARKLVRLALGETLSYDKLVLATGARNRELTVPGAERAVYLRSRDESDAIRQRLASAKNVAVIGGGFIGLEVAAAARMLGKPVVVIEAAPRLMARAVPPVLSDFFFDLHRTEGVEVLLNSSVAEITPEAIVLNDGNRKIADLVVAGIGVIANTELASTAELATNNGIEVDEFLRTKDLDIYAIGDCASHPNPFAGAGAGGNVRLESVQNAVDQAKCVAHGIVGNPAAYRDVPWFWTDQFQVRFQMVGLSQGYDEFALRGSKDIRKFSVFYFKGERLIAVDSVNRFGDHIAARKLLAAGTRITPQQASDEGVDLKKLV